MTLRCGGDSGQCRGQVSVAVAALKAARVMTPFAKASFGILPHHRRHVVLKLDRRSLRLLRTHGRGLSVSVEVSSRGRFIASTRTATLRLG